MTEWTLVRNAEEHTGFGMTQGDVQYNQPEKYPCLVAAVKGTGPDDLLRVLVYVYLEDATALMRAKTSCTIMDESCSIHNFQHGAEATELREGIEELRKDASPPDEWEGDEEMVTSHALFKLLDKVDARDSAAYAELIKERNKRYEDQDQDSAA